ncbi:unnamed protein product, partial [Brassica rapa subsp. trilocularis]
GRRCVLQTHLSWPLHCFLRYTLVLCCVLFSFHHPLRLSLHSPCHAHWLAHFCRQTMERARYSSLFSRFLSATSSPRATKSTQRLRQKICYFNHRIWLSSSLRIRHCLLLLLCYLHRRLRLLLLRIDVHLCRFHGLLYSHLPVLLFLRCRLPLRRSK